MGRYDYVKALLYAYPKLGMLAEAVADGAENKAKLSFRSLCDPLDLMEKIAEEIVTAKKLALLAAEMDEMLSGCTEEELFLLEYKYFRRKSELTGRFSGRELSCSERGYFRKQNALLGKIAGLLAMRGRTEEAFLREFGDFPPFMRLYRAIRAGRERKVVFKRAKRGIGFRQNCENSCGAGEARLPRSTRAAIATNASATAQIATICPADSPDFSDGSSAGSPDVFCK